MGLAACGSDDPGAVGLGTAGCLSDQQICQFKQGVSTKDEVQKALGNAQLYPSADTWIYVCQVIAGQGVAHNDMVTFDFDSSGVLSNVDVLRFGTAATPPPDCGASSTNPR